MKKSFKKPLIFAFVLAVILIITAITVLGSEKITVKEGSRVCEIGSTTCELSVEPFIFRGEVYLPVDDVLPMCGVSMGWDAGTSEIVCQKKGNEYRIKLLDGYVGVNGEKKGYKNYPVLYKGVVCIGEKLIRDISDAKVNVDGKLKTEYKEFMFFGDKEEWDNNGKMTKLDEKAFKYGGDVFVSADDVLPKMGYSLGWQDDISALVCVKDDNVHYVISQKNNIWVNENEYIFDSPSLVRDDKLYISASMIEKMENATVYSSGKFEVYYKRDLLETTVVGNNFRLPGNSVAYSGGVTVVDGVGMEMLSITKTSAANYAGVVNAIASSVPDVQVFNIAVPTAAEFYAPSRLAVDQTTGIKSIYAQLDKSVVPVNAVKALQEHADEHIYFKTDHHWTQRGAYYVYREFMNVKGIAVPELSEFENKPGYGFVGSLAGFAGASTAGNILRGTPETVERFIPKYATVGTVYEDMNMTRMQRKVNAVSTSSASYMAFIGGDGPVTVFHTDAPSDEVCVIIKESYGNAFATWALNNYKRVYVVDPRKFNGFGNKFFNKFNIRTFCDKVEATDLVLINYPGAISSGGIRQSILDMCN